MRHKVAGRKLGRTTSHREAMLRNLVSSLYEHGRVVTTVPKAKEARKLAERCITIAGKCIKAEEPAQALHYRRQLLKKLHRKEVVKHLIDEVAPQYNERPGGYTRILKAGFQPNRIIW